MSSMEPMGLKHEAETVFRRMQEEVYRLNSSKGWFDDDRTVGDMVALLHAEVSEILEAYRHWELKDATKANPPGFESGTPKPEGVGSEMADCLIRLLDMAKRWDVDLIAEYDRKMKFNWTRPYRHGRKNL
jgi:NTP pyrophosphatase (non-canonical NTP hydrolase)